MTRVAENHSGFTLVELLVAMTLLSVGVLALASSMAAVTRYQALATNRTEMILVADSKFEELRAIAAARTADTMQLVVGGSVTTPTTPYADTVTSGRGMLFEVLWQVTAGPAGSRSVQLRTRPLVDTPMTPAQLDFTGIVTTK